MNVSIFIIVVLPKLNLLKFTHRLSSLVLLEFVFNLRICLLHEHL
jgi:hypothetical protein